MKKRIYLIVVMALVAIFSLTLGFVFDQNAGLVVENQRALTLLYVAKGFSVALIIMVSIYILIKKSNYGNVTLLSIATIIFQLVPLLLRLVLRGDNPSFIWALVISFSSVIVYFLVFLGLDLSNDKLKKEKESETETP